MDESPRFLATSEVRELHRVTSSRESTLPGERDSNALESAVGQPRADWAYGGADLLAIGASYWFHIARAHPFIDGNKRAALAAMGSFLRLNGNTAKPGAAAVEALTLAVASGELSKPETVARVQELFGED